MHTLRATATGGASGLWYTYRNWRYAILFYSLLLTLAVVPLRRALGFPTGLLELAAPEKFEAKRCCSDKR